MSQKSVVIFHNADKPAAAAALPRLKTWFHRHGFRVERPQKGCHAEWAVALGGDGTLLATARCLAPLKVPVLGVNLGRLGFLAATNYKQLYPTLEKMIKGRLAVSSRMMLSAEVQDERAHLALNDCVIRGTDTARAVALSAWVGGKLLGTYVGDGLIVSTPTGSTAYSLAASGPIIEPEMDLLLLTPICSHSLNQRPVILSPDSVVEIRVEGRSKRDHVMMSLDGQVSVRLRAGDRLRIARAPERFYLVQDDRRSYFSVLREKFKWDERAGK